MRPSPKSVGWNSYCLFVLLLLEGFSAVGQPVDRPTPQSVPELLNTIEAVMKRQQIPGLMLAVVTRDSVIFSGGLGYSNLVTQRKVDGRQRFRMGSTTKMMVAMGILHLVHNGKITLDAKLSDVAPEIPFHNRWEETHPVRIINLLEHTTGFEDAFMNKTINLGETDRNGLDVLKFYQKQLESRLKPGTMPAYTNINYTVLGYVIESLTGKEWPEYLRENVLAPIGMHDTDFKLRLPDNGQNAQGYYTRGGKQIPVPSNFTLNSNGAHGSMNSCADDMAKLVRFFLNEWRSDTTQWLPESYLTEMETVHTTVAAKYGLNNGYGLGNHIETWHSKSTFHGHGGSIQGLLAHMIYDREKGIGMAIAKNGGYDDAPIAMLVADFLTRNMPMIESVEKKIPIDSIQPFLGYYKPFNFPSHYSFLENLVNDVSIGLMGDQLQLKPLRGWPIPLSHVGQLKFRMSFQHDPLYVFGQNEEGDKILMSAFPRGGTHYIKTSFSSIIFKRGLAVLGLLALVLSVIIGIVAAILIALKRIQWKQFSVFALPMLATLSLIIGLRPLVQSELNQLSFTEPNAVTLTIFFGTIFFGIFSFMGLSFLYAGWTSLKSGWIKVLLAFTTGGTAIVAVVFLANGMIGPMVWNW